MIIEKGKIVKGTGGFPKIPDLEEGMAILMSKIKALEPTPPAEGPPLPKVIELKWPKFLSRRFPNIFVP